MSSKVILFSNNYNELNNFLQKFYSQDINLKNSNSWHQKFSNPVDITELIGAFVDNISHSNVAMWISLDKNIYIKITPSNSNNIIKYIFERYPY